MSINPHNSWQRDVALIFTATCLLFCIGLGARPYLTPSEARYIELPRQMLATGDWLTPRINGVPYFEKPPLFYWMQAAVIGLFGKGEFAGRFMTALFSTFTCLATYAVGRILFGRLSGLLAAGVLATSLMGYGLSRVATLDVPVSFFITLCIGGFMAAQHMADPKHKRYCYMAMYAASALAVMTKGLIGIVIPGMVIGAWIALTRSWRILKEVHLITGLLLFLAITVPWHMLMARHHPDFLNFYFIHEHFTRYVSDEHKRTAPWWFFIAVTLAGLLPWLALLPGSIRRLNRKNPDHLFLLLWVFLPLLFFSSSHSKLIPYIFPIFPPLCIMIGDKLAQFWNGALPLKSLRKDAAFVVVLFGLLLLASQLIPTLPGKLEQKISLVTSGISPMMLAPMIVALAWLAYGVIRKHSAPALILSLAGFGVVTGLSVNYITANLDKATVKPLALPLKEKLQSDDMVVAYGSYWQDLPVYLDRNITVAGWTGELSFGVEHYPQTHEWMIGADEFWQRCANAPHAVYIFVREVDLAKLGEWVKHPGCTLQTTERYGNTFLVEKMIP